jgi:hypothetical protein
MCAQELQATENLRAEDLDRTFEEVADLVPTATPSLSDEALSRESIYPRDDEWNKELPLSGHPRRHERSAAPNSTWQPAAATDSERHDARLVAAMNVHRVAHPHLQRFGSGPVSGNPVIEAKNLTLASEDARHSLRTSP